MLPSDEQILALVTYAIPQGTLVNTTDQGATVTANGKPARLLGVDAQAQVYCAYLDEFEFLGYGAFSASQVTTP